MTKSWLRSVLVCLPLMMSAVGCVARIETDPAPSKIEVVPEAKSVDVDVNVKRE